MFKEIKSPPPHGKKLFEWDSQNRLLALARNRRAFLFKLSNENEFTCIATEGDTLPPEAKLNNEGFT